jgi:two-component system NarL family sensor kinase
MNTVPTRDYRWYPRPSSLRLIYAQAHRRAANAGFCALVARVLHSRLVVEEAVGFPADLTGVVSAALGAGIAGRVAREGCPLLVRNRNDLDSWPATGRKYQTDSFISYPFTLPGGSIAVVNVTEREDGTPFTEADLALLGQLVAFYAATFDAPARRETLRLRAELQHLRRQAIRTQEQERSHFAREIHDGASHVLSAAILKLEMMAHQPSVSVADIVAAAKEALIECADHLHDVAFHLRPRVLLDLGLAPALRSLGRRMRDASDVDVKVRIYGEERRFDEQIELAAFRIAQEATANAIRHAAASHINIALATTDCVIILEITDDGVGFSPATASATERPGGQGLRTMRERAEMVGGKLEIRSHPGAGCTIRAILPIGGET